MKKPTPTIPPFQQVSYIHFFHIALLVLIYENT